MMRELGPPEGDGRTGRERLNEVPPPRGNVERLASAQRDIHKRRRPEQREPLVAVRREKVNLRGATHPQCKGQARRQR